MTKACRALQASSAVWDIRFIWWFVAPRSCAGEPCQNFALPHPVVTPLCAAADPKRLLAAGPSGWSGLHRRRCCRPPAPPLLGVLATESRLRFGTQFGLGCCADSIRSAAAPPPLLPPTGKPPCSSCLEPNGCCADSTRSAGPWCARTWSGAASGCTCRPTQPSERAALLPAGCSLAFSPHVLFACAS